MSLKDKEIEINSMIDNKVYYKNDVKKAVLEFENILEPISNIETNKEKWIKKRFKQIFGDFNNKE